MLKRDDLLLLVIDVQEKLANVMFNMEETTKNIRLLIEAAHEFSMPILYTEQYPKGLGETIEPLISLLKEYNAQRFDKMSFSAMLTEEIKQAIESSAKKGVVICGIESHICVLSSAVDLKAAGYEVYIAKDATTSRQESFYTTAMDFFNTHGVAVVPSETLVFYWLEFAGTPSFKKLQKIILGKA